MRVAELVAEGLKGRLPMIGTPMTPASCHFKRWLLSVLLCAGLLFAQGTAFQEVTVVLFPHGPLAKEITVSGPFFLRSINRSGIPDLHLSLTKDSPLATASAAAAEVYGLDHRDGAQGRIQFLQLAPGTYYLTARQQLTWNVRLIVKP